MRVCCVHHHTSENQCTYTHLLIYVYVRMIKPYLHIQLPCKHTWKGLSTDTEHWKPFTVAFDDELHKRTLVVRVHLLRVCVSTDIEKNRHHNQHRTGQRVSVRGDLGKHGHLGKMLTAGPQIKSCNSAPSSSTLLLSTNLRMSPARNPERAAGAPGTTCK
jgi:hypothetical protein